MSGTSIIDVTFVDADTGKDFLKLKLPVRQLPSTFNADTTLNLGKDDWSVVEATPPSIEEIVQAGKLRLTLRKAQVIDPSTILFSLPTVADFVPAAAPKESLGDALLIHEDDWLQLELVPDEVVGTLKPDLDAIKDVLAHGRKGPGFERIHLRAGVRAPFAERELQLSALVADFGAKLPIAYRGHAGQLEDCFAFRLPSGGWLYGQERSGRVVALGLTTKDGAALHRLGRLTLIDWCAGEVYEAPHG